MTNIEESVFHDNAVFFIETDKVVPNPYQPRRDFDQHKLKDLAESIRMYGILQPLVVTRKEIQKEDGGLITEYELIAGERRLRASKIAGLREVPALIRAKEEDSRVKLELAIIENLQREDLNPVDRARAFHQLADEFGFKHTEIAKKMGKSREYVSNSLRILALPDDMLAALSEKKISEGHTRPLLMLSDRPQEQETLFREIMLRKMTVRDAEKISRRIAYDKVRKKERAFNPDIVEMEQEIGEQLGTRVHIEPKEVGGRIQIDYFSDDDLQTILTYLRTKEGSVAATIPVAGIINDVTAATPLETVSSVDNSTSEVADTESAQSNGPVQSEQAEPNPGQPGSVSVENGNALRTQATQTESNSVNESAPNHDYNAPQTQQPEVIDIDSNVVPDFESAKEQESIDAAPVDPTADSLVDTPSYGIQEDGQMTDNHKRDDDENGDLYSVKGFTI